MGRMKDLAIAGEHPDLTARRVRGKRARNRGNSFEREIRERLGADAKRTGQFGGKTDVEASWIAIQAKVGTSYPERIDGWLRSISVKGDQLQAVVLGDSPGAGGRRRTMIVLDFEAFVAWFGKEGSDVSPEA
jgi:hypothetical protein